MITNIAVVEDDQKSAELISSYIKRYEKESGESFSITCFSDGDEIASDYKPFYQIIFMDIQMKRMDGMSTAEYIRKLDKDVILVFITNMAHYAIKGYAVDAMDFLLKPVTYFVFSQQLKKSIEKLKSRASFCMVFPTKNGMLKLDVSQILYIASFSHKMVAYSKDNSYDFYGTMWQLEKDLSSKNFCRCNNSFLVNMAHIASVNGSEVKVGNHVLSVSRSRKKQFMEALARYCGG